MVTSSVKSSYRVWRVGIGESSLVGHVDAADYLEAVQAAEHRYGTDVQVYLPPAGAMYAAGHPSASQDISGPKSFSIHETTVR